MKPLPRHLQQAVAAVSTTVQELIFAVALHAAGMPDELPPKPDSGHCGAFLHNHPTPDDTERLRAFVFTWGRDNVERCGIGLAALAGRTAPEIDAFFGWEDVARYKLKWLRRLARENGR